MLFVAICFAAALAMELVEPDDLLARTAGWREQVSQKTLAVKDQMSAFFKHLSSRVMPLIEDSLEKASFFLKDWTGINAEAALALLRLRLHKESMTLAVVSASILRESRVILTTTANVLHGHRLVVLSLVAVFAVLAIFRRGWLWALAHGLW